MLAFIPLTQSVFWGTLAYTLIGGTLGGTVLTLVFLPALYAIWFKVKLVTKDRQLVSATRTARVAGEMERSWAGTLRYPACKIWSGHAIKHLANSWLAIRFIQGAPQSASND